MQVALPSRHEQLKRLQEEVFDILVVGGGATGAGIAVDSALRGLKTALVERGDFASGTSSRSTKLIHGGVRYLEAAFRHADRSQMHLVREALHERAVMLDNAPHLTRVLPIVIPLYSWLSVPYYLFGLKLYDWLSGKKSLGRSHYLSAQETLQRMPTLRKEGLKGSVVYYDGQFDDARMCVSLILTAAQAGAAVANYVTVASLGKSDNTIASATVKDTLSGDVWTIRAKVIINATGPFADALRRMDDPTCNPLLDVSAGTHILLSKEVCAPAAGILIPHTSDDRVLFILPWEGKTLVGTTDIPSVSTHDPQPTEQEIDFLLHHVNRFVNVPVTRQHIKASWTGLRPLVKNDAVTSTSQLSRDHVIEISPSNLITVVGGKWTTYRKMAEDAVNTAIKTAELLPMKPCQTELTRVFGYVPNVHDAIQDLIREHRVEEDIAQHLVRAYGSQASSVLNMSQGALGKRLVPGFPYLVGELTYAIQHEYACTPEDVLARRLRLSFLDAAAAEKILSLVHFKGQRS